jgi:hypothetical protein
LLDVSIVALSPSGKRAFEVDRASVIEALKGQGLRVVSESELSHLVALARTDAEQRVLDAFSRIDRAIVELWTRDASPRSPVRQLAEAELARRGLK